MAFPAVTSIYAAILTLLYVGMSFWVGAGRGKFGIIHGDGGNTALNRRIRAHANFAEYVPLVLLLTALLEAGGAHPSTIHWLLAPLTIARLIHPVGMLAPEGSRQQYGFRAPGAVVTLVVLVAAAVLLLIRAL